MDSRLLAGAYSKRYKYIEKEQFENLTNDDDLQNDDVLAKARRLSQETNKRRKLLAQKRKQETAREEKRRQEILNKRHQEQKQATEKYQRCHVGHRPRFSPSTRRRGHSPTKSRVDIDEALRLIRGTSTSSAPNEQSREAIQRLHNTQQNGRDPLERSHVRSSRAGSAGQRESYNRPSSGRPLDVSMRAQLMERSMRNLTSSRSRFEQQLEQHQQLLVDQQQKSLHDFNQAIRKEIDSDIKVQGLEESDTQDVALQSESLSSLDSLEEGNQSLGNSLQEQQAQRDFRQMSGQQGETFQTHPNNNSGGNSGMQQQRRPEDRTGRPQSAKVPVSRQQYNAQMQGDSSQHLVDTAGFTGPAGNAHIIGPIPQGYYSQSNGVPVSSTPVIQGNLTYYQDSLDVSQQPERHVAIGTALRLPQQPPPPMNQPIKQPAPTLQYDSQLLTHRRFEVRPNQNAGAGYGGSHMNTNQQEVDAKYAATKVPEGLTSAVTQNQRPEERPKAHIYAWTSPPPEENEPGQNSSAGQYHHNNNNNTSSYSASMVADRVMATNLHPQTCRTISTAATTTCVYQTVNTAPGREPVYTQAGMGNTVASTHHTSFATNSSHVEIPKNQGQKPGSVLTSAGTYPSTTGLKFGSAAPSSYLDHLQMSQHRQQGSSQAPVNGHQQNQQERGKGPQQTGGGSLARGTLGLVDGKLSTINIPQTDPTPMERRVTVVEDGKKEVRSILKKVNREALKAGVQTKFNVQDSLEITRMHMMNHEQVKRKKAQKKGVRFADLHYHEEVEEDTDSADSMIDINAAANNTNSSNSTGVDSQADGTTAGPKGAAQRPRPVSARVTSANAPRAAAAAAAESRSRVPRVASAGPARQPPAARPKAAAHIIITGGDVGAHNGQQAGAGYESGITAHKSQLEKKVMLINNNFMSRLPVYSATGTTETPISTAAVYSVSGGKVRGTAAMPPTSSASMAGAADFAGNDTNGHHGKTSRGGKSVAVPAPHATVLPSHSHFSNGNAHKAVYNENGMRTDRTPTDDEINHLWRNMRTMLDVSEGNGAMPPSSSSLAAAGSEQGPRPQVQVAHQYIDGAALGIPNGMRRQPGYPNGKPQPTATTAAAANNGAQHQQNGGGAWKTEGQAKNGYLQRYSLLQQRRTPASGIGVSSRANDVVEQTVQPMPLGPSASDPRHPATAVSISYAPREEMTESMAGFLAAEQAVQTHGGDVHDSRVMAAMESAQNQQEIYNSIRQKLARGGPTALSLEEHQLLESLDKLNDRLKVVENRQTSHQQTNNNPANHIFVQGSGFRGHQVMTSQSYRRNSGGQRSAARPVSARLLTRPYR